MNKDVRKEKLLETECYRVTQKLQSYANRKNVKGLLNEMIKRKKL